MISIRPANLPMSFGCTQAKRRSRSDGLETIRSWRLKCYPRAYFRESSIFG